jgi:hypothetical protein
MNAHNLSGMTQAELIDLNTDGIQDLVAVGPGGSRAFYGEVDATFTAFDALGAAFGDVAAQHLFLLDTDRDRDLDVVTIGAAHTIHQTGLVGADIASFTTGAFGLVTAPGDAGGAGDCRRGWLADHRPAHSAMGGPLPQVQAADP